ncbi:MAG: S46 family peptidase [Ignavibacteriaceae bacterium]|nr:S46 family peptidase [Ignavibacteriaceae bacterium]
MNLLNLELLKRLSLVVLTLWVVGCSSTSQVDNYKSEKSTAVSADWIKLDNVKAGRFDTGKMWTFDFPPVDYFKEEYNFNATDEWLNNVRMSALRFANYCSASFVSEDGLVMTNHHCGRQSITEVSTELEDLPKNGFYAATLEEERKVEGLFVDQLVHIEDVTKAIQAVIDTCKNDADKATARQAKSKELEAKLSEEKGFKGSVVTLYNGGRYSLYGYKTYKDVRLVLAPETQLGFFGGDPDNFTYPRYALDFTFFRVYDDEGKPLKTKNYYKWSPNGAAPGEPVFVVGNPGSTNRLYTVAQLEYQRDISHPVTLAMLDGLVHVYEEYLKENPDKKFELQDRLFSFANSQKAYGGILGGLRDPFLMQKKRDFEKNFKAAVFAKENLKKNYGHLWDNIASTRKELSEISWRSAAYQVNPRSSSAYFTVASNLVNYAKQLQLPEDKREPKYKGEMLDSTIAKLFPKKFDESLNKKLLAFNLDFFAMLLGENDPLVTALTSGKKGKVAAEYALSKSVVKNAESVEAIAKKGADAILNSGDPLINYILKTQEAGKELQAKAREISLREAAYVQELGRAVYEVYGTSIPPDATFSLRIADGVVEGYKYNGTVAPPITTFYGLYDRFHSFKGKEEWELPQRWQNPPAEFDLATPVNFVSTNDIIGGNSGSPVINKKAEVVGLAFDGNIESLPGQFIFHPEANRTVSVHSAGMLEAIQDLYLAKRISKELKNGKITE